MIAHIEIWRGAKVQNTWKDRNLCKQIWNPRTQSAFYHKRSPWDAKKYDRGKKNFSLQVLRCILHAAQHDLFKHKKTARWKSFGKHHCTWTYPPEISISESWKKIQQASKTRTGRKNVCTLQEKKVRSSQRWFIFTANRQI